MKNTLYIVLLVVCLGPFTLTAQMRRNAAQRPAVERIESLKKVRMMEALNLDENQSVKLIARYTAHRERLHEMEEEARTLIDKLDGQIQSNASDADLNQTFASLLDLDRRKLDVRTKFINDLRDVLTTKQIAEYVVFERNFARDLRDAVRDVKLERQRH